MQQTKKYQLNLIDRDDAFTPDALNENTEIIEEVLSQNLGRMDAEIGGKGTCTVRTGSFKGDGIKEHEIELGFAPSFLIIYGTGSGQALSFTTQNWRIMYQGGTFYQSGATLTENGFTVSGTIFNNSGYTTYYAAFS